MLTIVLAFPVLWLWTTNVATKWRRTLWVLVSLATLLSLSKEIALIALGTVLLDPRFERRFARWKTALTLVVAVALWTGTHVLVVVNTPVHHSYLAGTPYTSERVLFAIGKVQIVETTYAALKRANWIIGRDHPLFGVGPGNSNTYLPALKAQGAYPPRLPDYDPHSTWMGGFSETGILGLITLGIMVAGWFTLVRQRGLITSNDSVIRAAAAYLLILVIESVMIDAMNFRHLWIAVGLVMAYTPPGGTPIFESGDSAS
jgi:O-antigen ligase